MSFAKIDEENSQRPRGKNCILVSGYNEKELILLSNFIKKVGIEKIIEVKDENEILNQIIDEVNNNLNKSSEKVIVFNSVSDKELNTFINNFKVLNLSRPLFAVVTPTSAKWKFKELVSELLKEKKAFENR
ncbi:MAG: hypothetical protein B6I28_04905 [Fusobacteriia bacterium 4572_132]|nr:MAG: hypothetical protein B6I28_04905 [Fusobacteriia bacterium 4572_132]